MRAAASTPVLRVGLNKVALLRSSRGSAVPDLGEAARVLVEGGCRALLVHQWPDHRHVKPEDVSALSRLEVIRDERASLHVGGDLREDLGALLERTPGVGCWVVTPFEAQHLTTQRGWRAEDDQARLVHWVRSLQGRTRISVFVDPEPAAVDLVARAGAAAVELNCRAYVEGFETPARERALEALTLAADRARQLGLEVNAAHDLDRRHLPPLIRAVRPTLVSVGHAFVAAAVIAGLREVLPGFLQAASEE
ncbi:pyridoxine 5'-phosphate synthase [Myxococcus fulvus]|uniref:pyridoxine 5'-phosphate synthase n=1 Tax=Myxococcus fulvus TaxID=33 RepID=UPI00200B804A|nr:pyridoxine 5'-phosphate synthase [Myxococcus fulvus]MCK8499853.1 pyridoxine 5'-phosphate synthase [Myxococcus fulvus]